MKCSSRDLTVTTTKAVIDDLDALVKTGLFGVDRAKVAEELLRAALRHVVLDGWL